jgi:hypothetical protein
MSTVKIKLDKDLIDRAAKFAAAAGYSSTEEFVAHCVEKVLDKALSEDSAEEIEKKLKGLGYIS